jgi:hypothetical protein
MTAEKAKSKSISGDDLKAWSDRAKSNSYHCDKDELKHNLGTEGANADYAAHDDKDWKQPRPSRSTPRRPRTSTAARASRRGLMNRKAIVIPKAAVAKLGNGDHEGRGANGCLDHG